MTSPRLILQTSTGYTCCFGLGGPHTRPWSIAGHCCGWLVWWSPTSWWCPPVSSCRVPGVDMGTAHHHCSCLTSISGHGNDNWNNNNWGSSPENFDISLQIFESPGKTCVCVCVCVARLRWLFILFSVTLCCDTGRARAALIVNCPSDTWHTITLDYINITTVSSIPLIR